MAEAFGFMLARAAYAPARSKKSANVIHYQTYANALRPVAEGILYFTSSPRLPTIPSIKPQTKNTGVCSIAVIRHYPFANLFQKRTPLFNP